MGLPRLAIEHPITTTMGMMICIVLGLSSIVGSPVELMPRFSPPIAVIVTTYPGASPEEVASKLTQSLEAGVSTVGGIKGMSSTSRESMSMIVLQFNWGTNMGEARADLQERLDRIDLPDGAGRPSLLRYDPNTMPIVELAAATGEDLVELKARLERNVRTRLERIDGVASVVITGAPEKQVQVLLNQEKMQKFGLTQADICSAIQASNLTLPAGVVGSEDRALDLRVVARMNTVDDLKSLIVAVVPEPTDGLTIPASLGHAMPLRPVRLQDIAEVRQGLSEPTVISMTNGRPSLRLAVQKKAEFNTAAVARAVIRELGRIRRDDPDLHIITVMNQGDIISRAVGNVANNLVTGAGLAMVVLFFFLRSLAPTLIVGIAIPFSVIVTFVLLRFQNLTLNIMTLGGLALGVGMLVDNSIVVIENIYRHLNDLGEEPKVAAESGTSEVSGAIIASTLTTVAVFLPVAFVGGLTGELFRELAVTVAFSLIASLAVALTVIPMLGSRFLRPKGGGLGRHKGSSTYARLLKWSLGHRAFTLIGSLLLLLATLTLIPYIGTEFIPTMDEGSFRIGVSMPPGTRLDTTADRLNELAEAVQKHPGVSLITTTAGSSSGIGPTMGGNQSSGNIIVVVDKGIATDGVMKSLRPVLDRIRGDAELSYTDNSVIGMGSGQFNSIQLRISGPSHAKVRKLVDQIREEMSSVPGIVGLGTDLEVSRPEIQVRVDRDRAMSSGLVGAQIGMTVSDAVKGRTVTRLEEGEDSMDVRVVYRPEDRESIEVLRNLLIRTPIGRSVALDTVASLDHAHGPVSIIRDDQRSSAQIAAMIQDRDLGSVTADVMRRVNSLVLPPGYWIRPVGASQLMNEGFGSLRTALLMAVLLTYMIMAGLFESLLHPFIIMFSMPLAVVGVILGLFISGYPLGITAMIGLITLAGIVVNNGIVLVDFTNKLRAKGMEISDAIHQAARDRLRPILMTALTTILALIPLALGIGQGTEMQAPLAVTVIGGLLTSTVLTLFIVPVVYYVLSGIGLRQERHQE